MGQAPSRGSGSVPTSGTPGTTASPAAQTEVTADHRRHDLLFGIEISLRYHRKRRDFFDRVAKLSRLVIAFAGTGVAANVIREGPWWVSVVVGLMVTFLSVMDLVFNLGQARQLASELAEDFADLEKDLRVGSIDVGQAEARRLDLEKREPATRRALWLICRNEAVLAGGYPAKEIRSVGTLQRFLAHLVDFRPALLDAALARG